MRYINTFSLTPAVNDWLANTRHPRTLHIFDRVCNLVNEHREVLSIVTPQIGDGPFNLVVEDDALLSDYLNLQSPISISPNQLHLGDLTINTADAKLWNPRPNWDDLHSKREFVLRQAHEIALPSFDYAAKERRLRSGQLAMTEMANYQFSISPAAALANADLPSVLNAARQLAGLGQGLTPAGDDFLMGAMYAIWIIHPQATAKHLASEIADTAVPLTTSLSGAWLRSAGKGQAGILWHELFNSLLLPLPSLQSPISNLLAVGETSGADALAGFIGTFISYAESEAESCHF